MFVRFWMILMSNISWSSYIILSPTPSLSSSAVPTSTVFRLYSPTLKPHQPERRAGIQSSKTLCIGFFSYSHS